MHHHEELQVALVSQAELVLLSSVVSILLEQSIYIILSQALGRILSRLVSCRRESVRPLSLRSFFYIFFCRRPSRPRPHLQNKNSLKKKIIILTQVWTIRLIIQQSTFSHRIIRLRCCCFDFQALVDAGVISK